MYKPYKKPVIKASPDIKLPEPRISIFVLFLLKIFGRLYLFLFYGVSKAVLNKEKMLFDAFNRALSGKSRCIIAFRHPNGGEPQLLAWFFLFHLRRCAAKQGVHFSHWPHAIFVYGYDVIRWGGWVARYIMPNVGAMPIYHSKVDIRGMTRIYNTISDGPFPVAIAPEGQVSYSTDSVPRLEPGVIRIGFSVVRHLEKKNINCPVEILPLSIHYRFGSWGKLTIEILLRNIEKFCGYSRREERKLPFGERIRKCRDHILELNETRYNIANTAPLSAEERMEKIANAALETAERKLDLKKEGDFFTRQHRVRQICWDRIYLPGIYKDNLNKMTQIKRSVMDLAAGEAWYISRHQELADLCWYFRGQLPAEDDALHNKIEFIQNLHDLANRTMGGAYANRVSIFPRKVIIKAAPVINLTERINQYNKDKKTTTADTLSDLHKAFLDNIEEMYRTEQG